MIQGIPNLGSFKLLTLIRRGELIGETNFLGRDRDQEIRLIKTYYETETEK